MSDGPKAQPFAQPFPTPWGHWHNRTGIVGPTGQSFAEPLARWADNEA